MVDFDWPVRVYYEDTDSGGVVYHGQYLNFMERARTEWLRSLGFEQDILIKQHHCIFAVHSMEIQFKQPARFNDALMIHSRLMIVKGASLLFQQKIFCNDELLCQAKVKVACLDSIRFRPMPIPAFMMTELQR
jgi:acyl-CoA thioester hydrolase